MREYGSMEKISLMTIWQDLPQKCEKVLYMQENKLGYPTIFEVITAIGFSYFKEKEVDFLVLEVGMGGRLDATNVVTPVVSVITPISFDHQQYLGKTLTEIAREKCGIIKPRIPVVSGHQEDEVMQEIEKISNSNGCCLTKVINTDFKTPPNAISYRLVNDNIKNTIFELNTPRNVFQGLKLRLLGRHQLGSAATAVGAVEQLSGINIAKEAIYSGIEKTKWPGRMEIVSQILRSS